MTASARLEVAMQSAFRGKFSYTMAVRGHVGRGIDDGALDEDIHAGK